MADVRSIYFIRHGEKEASSTYNSIYNKKLGLTEKGKEQAERISAYLTGCNIKHIYSSDYDRTLQTSAPTSNRLCLPVIINKGFGERILLTKDVDATASKSKFIKSQHDWSYKSLAERVLKK